MASSPSRAHPLLCSLRHSLSAWSLPRSCRRRGRLLGMARRRIPFRFGLLLIKIFKLLLLFISIWYLPLPARTPQPTIVRWSCCRLSLPSLLSSLVFLIFVPLLRLHHWTLSSRPSRWRSLIRCICPRYVIMRGFVMPSTSTPSIGHSLSTSKSRWLESLLLFNTLPPLFHSSSRPLISLSFIQVLMVGLSVFVILWLVCVILGGWWGVFSRYRGSVGWRVMVSLGSGDSAAVHFILFLRVGRPILNTVNGICSLLEIVEFLALGFDPYIDVRFFAPLLAHSTMRAFPWLGVRVAVVILGLIGVSRWLNNLISLTGALPSLRRYPPRDLLHFWLVPYRRHLITALNLFRFRLNWLEYRLILLKTVILLSNFQFSK